jgi:predicted nucleic acid-binding Zn ribbon protein
VTRRRTPRPASSAIRDLADRLAPATTLAVVQRAWPQAAGEAFAAQSEPTGEAGGVVTVTCSSAVWAQELDLLSGEVIARLNAALGEDRITGLRCRSVGPRTAGGRPR